MIKECLPIIRNGRNGMTRGLINISGQVKLGKYDLPNTLNYVHIHRSTQQLNWMVFGIHVHVINS